LGAELGPWTSQSHITPYSIRRSLHYTGRYLADLRRARPVVSPRTTFFFAGIPGSVMFQVGEGPLVRWVYRDSTLRVYFLHELSLERAARGPLAFFVAEGESLHDRSSDPQLLETLAYDQLL